MVFILKVVDAQSRSLAASHEKNGLECNRQETNEQ